MKSIYLLDEISVKQVPEVGGKAASLAEMKRKGLPVPDAVCIPRQVYDRYVDMTGLRGRIFLELGRKDFSQMRWEEMWDASLRIRNMFLTTPLPEKIERDLAGPLETRFGGNPLAVRSSAPGEDAAGTSFAGLHESYLNVRGLDAVLDHVRKVWASLWADGALLYRKELGLDIRKSAMAVVIQEIVAGECSGVIFCKNPLDETRAVLESVWGLNQGLVDGVVEPDRWILDRKTGEILSHAAPSRTEHMICKPEGVDLVPLPPQNALSPPLSDQDIARVFSLAMKAERIFEAPQDVEWTIRDEALFLLQSRPITTGKGEEGGDKKSWYLSLRRSFQNLKALGKKIEGTLIPAMIREADELAALDPASLDDKQLSVEIEKRAKILKKWTDVYWDEFIPFAHGARLFGQVYNDVMRPEDPHEFIDLLGGGKMTGMERNRDLENLAGMIRGDSTLREALEAGDLDGADPSFQEALESFISRYADYSYAGDRSFQNRKTLLAFLLRAASVSREKRFDPKETEEKRERFLSCFEGEKRSEMIELLKLARTSYRLRDDDNIYLGRIEGRLEGALEEATKRLRNRWGDLDGVAPGEIARALRDPRYFPRPGAKEDKTGKETRVRTRQVRGQPAGPGIATGIARVIGKPADLFEFQGGEILVCDAIDPNMTFAVPLASAIVERRGGMLIHGAIIAREYGLPCVTGVPDATRLIRTGDRVTVDGHLGLVILRGN